jgi:class 3 adenylate cyclase/DNA-binding CsgD family transcriptional regulator/tetratricopeptide (TPR) repeat protein
MASAAKPPKGAGSVKHAAQIQTFLIADVRGYTAFTQTRGDEAAADLTTRFAKMVRAGVEAYGGVVIELRGDEALSVFGSPRQAIRASIELQRRFVEATVADPSFPLPVGIGLDAGEAVPVEGGFRGGALNLAARLCSLAGPAEVFASATVTHLARRVDGVTYADRGSTPLKGFEDPVQVVQLTADVGDAGQDAAFREVLESIASQKKSGAVPGRAPTHDQAGAGLQAEHSTEGTPMVFGREAELDLVDMFLEHMTESPSALVIRGEAGIGKTTLWRSGLTMATQRGYRVLSCRPAEAEAKLPFAAIGDLFDEVLRKRLGALPPPQRQALDVALLQSEPEGPPPDQRAVSVAVLSAIRLVAEERPLLVGIDDVQWLDRPSQRVLEFSARRLSGTAVGMILGIRAGLEETVPLGLERAMHPDRLTTMDLRSLPEEAIDNLLRTRLATAFRRPTLRKIMRISNGNPFFALELGRAVLRRGVSLSPADHLPVPENLRQLVTARLARLRPAERTVLLAASALSQPTVDLLSAATDENVRDLLEGMTDRGIVQSDGRRVAFTHPLLASTLYAESPDWERRGVHGRLARVVTDPVERARHLALAASGTDEDTARTIEEAAQLALARAAPETAAELAEQSVRLSVTEGSDEMRRRQVEAAEFHIITGDRERARALIEEAIAGAGPGPIRARAVHALALIRGAESSWSETVGLLLEAAADSEDDPLLRATIEIELAFFLYQSGQVPSAEEHAQLGARLAERAGSTAILSPALTTAAYMSFVLGKGEQTEAFRRAQALTPSDPRLSSLPYPTWVPFEPGFHEALLAKWSDNFAHARTGIGELRNRMLERHEEARLGPILFQLAEMECWAGNWSVAERYAEECRNVILQGAQQSEALYLTAQGQVFALRGDVARARAAAQRALQESTSKGDVAFSIRNENVLGFLALSAGDAASARPFYERALLMARSGGYGDPGLFRFQADAVETWVQTGGSSQAEDVVAHLEEQGRQLDRPWALVAAARGRALLAAANGQLDDAMNALERALEHHQRLEMPFERGRTLLVLGGVRRRARQKRGARDVLEQALGMFEHLGANVWAARTRAEIGRIGGRAPAPTGLTPTEEQIARLAGDGLTNREIAEALFMSAKTVERHLAHVFAKLGIESRRELVRRRGDEGRGSNP